MTIVVGMAAGAATAADPAINPEPGPPVHLICSTDALVFKTELFKPSRGDFDLVLEILSLSQRDPNVVGIWRLLAAPKDHPASLAALQAAACAAGCPLLAPVGKPYYELWAPKRVSPEALAPEETLSVATLDPVTLALRASSIQAKEVIALEKGLCKLALPKTEPK